MTTVNILVVDDNPDIIETVQEIFEAKYPESKVEGAISGPLALKKMSESAPDVVLLDIMMPDMDGWAVASRMHEDENLRNIPIIYLTAKADQLSQMMGDISSEDYIFKPFRADDIVSRVKSVLTRYRHIRNYPYLAALGLIDAAILAISTLITAAYVGSQHQTAAKFLTLPAVASTLTPTDYAITAVIWAATFITTLYAADYVIKKFNPRLYEEKEILHKANHDYWRRNTNSLYAEVIPLWLLAFLPAYAMSPTITTAPLYIAAPAAWGIYRIIYKPRKLQWRQPRP
jgi:DNA-binding response OmpR family regulator